MKVNTKVRGGLRSAAGCTGTTLPTRNSGGCTGTIPIVVRPLPVLAL